MSAYNVFAKYYDTLTQNIDYSCRADYFCQLIKEYGNDGSLLLDLACGTGSLSCEFMKRGYDVIGVDSSYEMLAQAMDKSPENSNIQYIRQTMQGLDLYGTVDACVCALDSINHIIDMKALEKCFSRISLFLNPDGVFIFDVNTPYKHTKILADNTFVYDYDSIYCVWQNTFNESSCITSIILDFFEYDQQKKLYSRSEESFEERAYTHEELKKLLDAAGLKIEACYGDDTFEPVKEETQRAIYVIKKK